MIYVKCGTPNEYCNGQRMDATARLGKTIRVHPSHSEAYVCYTKYLKNVMGYKAIGGHAFSRGNDEPILIVTKPSRYGGRMRTGKASEGGKYRARRASPRGSGALIIG